MSHYTSLTWLLLSILATGSCYASTQHIVMGYAGARPSAISPIDPSTMPTDPTGQTASYIALAFAFDSDRQGNMAFYPGMTITPAQIAQAQQGGRRFLVSMAGDAFHWKAVGSNWVGNAVASLSALATQYHLDGIDLNYENFDDQVGFATAWCDVLQRLRALRPDLNTITIAPFAGTNSQYGALYQRCGSLISWVNYQNYAEAPSQQQNSVNNAARLYGGIANIAIGLVTSKDRRGTVSDAAGLALVAANPGCKGAFIWTLEDSAATTRVLVQNLYTVLDGSPTCARSVVVKSKDTCDAIALAAGITTAQLQVLNPGVVCTDLQIGQVLCVVAASGKVPPAPAPPPPSGCSKSVTVVDKDSCYSISAAAGLSLAQLAALNPTVDCNLLQLGEVLCIAGPSTCLRSVVVKANDLCDSIALTAGITLTQLLALNKGLVCTALQLGQVLCVKGPTTCGRSVLVVPKGSCYDIYTAAGITYAQLLALNPTLNCNALQVGQSVCVAALTSCPSTVAIVSGDTCASVSLKTGVSVTNLSILNPGLSCKAPLVAGTVLCLANAFFRV